VQQAEEGLVIVLWRQLPKRGAQQIPGEEDADDGVAVLGIDRNFGVAGAAHLLSHVGQGYRGWQGHDLGARGHDLPHDRVAEIENLPDVTRFLCIESPLADGLLGQGAHHVLGDDAREGPI
jgi:hypothetical protein